MNKSSLNKFINLINQITEMPHLYQISNARQLHCFIEGYIHGTDNAEAKKISIFINEFSSFVKMKLNVNNSLSWSKSIELYSTNDYQSLILFKRLLDEFHSSLEG